MGLAVTTEGPEITGGWHSAANSTLTRLLVVGGNGFIGQHIVRRALGLLWDVSSLNFSMPDPKNRIEGVRYLVADISDNLQLRAALTANSFEYVVNCGGYIDHTLFSAGGRKVFDAHFSGALNLVQLLDRKSLKAYINIGSSDEYGNSAAPQVEDLREAPISPYSIGKVAATHLLEMLHKTESFPGTTLRLFLVYGPGQDMRRFLPQIIKGCIENRSFPTSAGTQLRDFCFITDVVDAVFRTFFCESARGQSINIGSGDGVSIRQMIEIVREHIGAGEPRYGEIPYRTGENMALYGNVSKAKLLLNWAAGVPLQEGLQQTINWYRDQH